MQLPATPPIRVGNFVREVLDVLPVTDEVFHQLAFTRPLVDVLITEVCRASRTGRVLVIGPNEVLPAVLIELGYEVDLWVLDGLPLSEGVRRLASRCGRLDEVLGTHAAVPADVVLAPYIVEAAGSEPAQLLATLGTLVKPGGTLVIACRHPGELRRRLRRVICKVTRDAGPPVDSLPPSLTWPALPARRLLSNRDLASGAAGQFRVVRSQLVIDQRAFMTTEALSVWKWLLKDTLHAAKAVVPQFRDCSVVTLVPAGGSQPGAARI